MRKETEFHRITDTHIGRIRTLIVRAIDEGRRSVTVGELERALLTGAHTRAMRAAMSAVSVIEDAMEEPMEQALIKCMAGAGNFAARSLVPLRIGKRTPPLKAGKIGFAFDRKRPEVIKWARQHAADLVVEITNETRKAIRAAITRGFAEGIAPRDTAVLLRNFIGLDTRRSEAVDSLRARLLDSPGRRVIAGKVPIRVPANGIGRAKLESALRGYADRLTKQRALMIARTETILAGNEGQRQAWNQAVQKGLLTGREKREWIATGDNRVCPICERLDGTQADMNGAFPNGLPNPPAHPLCRCTTGLSL